MPASRRRGIKIGCHYSLTQFFFNLPRSSRYASYLPTYLRVYVCVCIHIRRASKPLRTRAVSSSSNFCDASSLRVFPGSSSSSRAPEADTFPRHERDSQAFMRISIYSGTLRIFCLDDEGKSAFDNDDGEINETIDLRVTFNRRLLRHRSSLDLLGCSLARVSS